MPTTVIDYTKQLHAEIDQTPEEYRPLLLRIVHSFNEGWKEVVAGKTHPIETLWGGIDVD